MQKITLPISYSYDETVTGGLYSVFTSITGVDVTQGASTAITEFESATNPRSYKTNSFFHIGLYLSSASWFLRWITIGYCKN